jgi:hypothetical protein
MFLGGAQVISTLGTTATVLTTDLLIKTIQFTTSGIFSVGKALLTPSPYVNHTQLEDLEKELDLFETIKIYELYIKEILEKDNDHIDSSETLKITIHSIYAALNDLHQILKEIDAKVEYHKTVWFPTWRTLDFTDEVHKIKHKKNILDSRFNILQKIYK